MTDPRMGAAARQFAIKKLKAAPAVSSPSDMSEDVEANEGTAETMTCPSCGHEGEEAEFRGAPDASPDSSLEG